ncbi:MAG: hypothetical protein AABY22_02075 [Nanoarchaeota archaeon]
MGKITIDLPEDLKFIEGVSSIELSMAMQKILRSRLDEAVRIKRIAGKSKATEKDVEDLTNEIKEAVWEHYSK